MLTELNFTLGVILNPNVKCKFYTFKNKFYSISHHTLGILTSAQNIFCPYSHYTAVPISQYKIVFFNLERISPKKGLNIKFTDSLAVFITKSSGVGKIC